MLWENLLRLSCHGRCCLKYDPSFVFSCPHCLTTRSHALLPFSFHRSPLPLSQDPLYTNWTKPSYNPIVENTQRDPSTAWQLPSGEWRLTSFDSTIYATMDFKSWYTIGKSQFPQGECPSFFELPAAYPGTEQYMPIDGSLPTHVHKCSHGGKDWMQFGTYGNTAVSCANRASVYLDKDRRYEKQKILCPFLL